MNATSKSQVKRIATQSSCELSRQLRRIADNLRVFEKAHTELPFLHLDAEWVTKAADVIDSLPKS